jgi:hypothetical protein
MTSSMTNSLYDVYLKAGIISLIAIFMFIGCASSPAEFRAGSSGPQIIVDPDTIRLGVAKLSGTHILFKGKGFDPGDSVFIKLLEVDKDGKKVDIPIADAEVDKNGYFISEVGILPKINDMLRAELGSNEKMETIIVITQPSISEGVYTVKAISMESNKTAETSLTIKGPTILDRIKDWVGVLLGKIKKK